MSLVAVVGVALMLIGAVLSVGFSIHLWAYFGYKPGELLIVVLTVYVVIGGIVRFSDFVAFVAIMVTNLLGLAIVLGTPYPYIWMIMIGILLFMIGRNMLRPYF